MVPTLIVEVGMKYYKLIVSDDNPVVAWRESKNAFVTLHGRVKEMFNAQRELVRKECGQNPSGVDIVKSVDGYEVMMSIGRYIEFRLLRDGRKDVYYSDLMQDPEKHWSVSISKLRTMVKALSEITEEDLRLALWAELERG